MRSAGFTLIEALVALAILAMVIFSLLGSRTQAMIDAAEARNTRLAKKFANELMSELQAGARDLPPGPERFPIQGYKDFAAQFFVGEDKIMEYEANLASDLDMEQGGERSDRLAYQRDRNALRRSREQGISFETYQDQRRDEQYAEDEDEVPSEDEFEDVMVVISFPNVRITAKNSRPEATYSLKAKVSTMAIEGLTPEQADALAASQGSSASSAAASPLGGSNASGSQSGGSNK